jgi:hypothetical protein
MGESESEGASAEMGEEEGLRRGRFSFLCMTQDGVGTVLVVVVVVVVLTGLMEGRRRRTGRMGRINIRGRAEGAVGVSYTSSTGPIGLWVMGSWVVAGVRGGCLLLSPLQQQR